MLPDSCKRIYPDLRHLPGKIVILFHSHKCYTKGFFCRIAIGFANDGEPLCAQVLN